MTISTAYAPDVYAGNGSTTVFAVTFNFLSTSGYVNVSLKNNTTGVVTLKTITTHYTISGSNVTMLTAPASGETLIIELDPAYTQLSDYTENGALPAETLERDLDLLCLEAQLAKDQSARAIKVDSSVDLDTFNTTLPNAVASGVIGFNSGATGLAVVSLASISAVTLPLSVADGGLGAVTLGTDGVLTGNGTSAVQAETTVKVVSGILTLNNGATGAGQVDLLEDSDNGTSKTQVKGAAALAGDITITLPDTTDTLVGKATTDTLTNKTLNADGTGNVITNIGSSEVKSELITGQSLVTAAVGDHVMVADASDSDNLKKVTVQTIVNLASSTSKIIQVVTSQFTSTTTVTGQTMADTGVTVTITPTLNTSTILVIADLCVGTAALAGSDGGWYKLVRGSTDIDVGVAGGSRTLATTGHPGFAVGSIGNVGISFIDSPATTSATTYKVQFSNATAGQSTYINRTATDSDSSAYVRGSSTITVMEIAA